MEHNHFRSAVTEKFLLEHLNDIQYIIILEVKNNDKIHLQGLSKNNYIVYLLL